MALEPTTTPPAPPAGPPIAAMAPLCAVFRRYLKSQHLKYTPERADILNSIIEADNVFEVDQLLMEMRRLGHRVSKATIYRTIKLLIEAGVVCKLSMPDGAPKYSLARAEHHHHTLCIDCGKVGEFRASTIERVLRAIGEDISGKIVGHSIEFHIVCQSCLSK